MDQNELRKKTIAKLQELFQLDQPDLDFGFYRVMHVKAKEISDFIDNKLLGTIQTAFDTAAAEKASGELETVRASVVASLGEDALDSAGALKPEYHSTPVGKKYLKAYQNAGTSKSRIIGAEQVYTHLYRFFSRYYDSGDFVSMRYHARETSSVAKPYAIPYGGEEVMLYWANADQYYIKTTENFRDFTFDPAAAPEIQNLPEDQRNLILGTVTPGQYKVHFTIVEADQGEHGNIKSADDSKREFFLSSQPVSYENEELVVRFEYRTPGDGDQISEAREKELQERFGFTKKSNVGLFNAAAQILDALAADSAVPEPYSVLLNVSAPTESVKKRPLLAKYLHKYTAANKSDYFIHKNLRAFLRRELDFYIKNEIMNLDDVSNADVSVVENMLRLIKVFREIAIKLIDFLGQLEDFQKRLWLKKKFVVECNYCITLDRIRSAVLNDQSVDSSQTRRDNLNKLLSEIYSNERQIAEWERLGFDVSGLRVKLGGGGGPGSSQNEQLLLGEMENEAQDPNDYLMVDTQFFTPEFKKRLLSYFTDFDSQCDGLLIHSENFQALNLLQERYRGVRKVRCLSRD